MSGNAADECEAFEREHHLMHGRWRDLEMALQVGLCGGPTVDLGVGVDERKILPLKITEGGRCCIRDRHGMHVVIDYLRDDNGDADGRTIHRHSQ